MAFLLHGLEFARVRMGYVGQSFNRHQEITFGAGANETPLTEETEADLRELAEGGEGESDEDGGGQCVEPILRVVCGFWG